MAKGLLALEAQISALAQADAERRVAKVMKAAEKIAKALAKVTKEIASFQKMAGGKARPGRKPGRRPGRKPGHKPGRRPGRKPGRKLAVNRGKKAGITPAALKSLRKKLGVNQDGLAKILKVSLSSIRTWEQGRAKPRAAKLAKILSLQAESGRKVKAKAGRPRKARKAGRPRKIASKAPPAEPVVQEEAKS